MITFLLLTPTTSATLSASPVAEAEPEVAFAAAAPEPAALALYDVAWQPIIPRLAAPAEDGVERELLRQLLASSRRAQPEPTATAVPPTATPLPTATAVPPTPTRVPPTNTPVPPRPTNTPVPPTATPVPPPPPPAAVPANVSVAAEEAGLALINGERQRRGLKALVMNEPLRALARAYGQDMANRNYFAHNTPEGLTPFDRMRRAGIAYRAAAENLGYTFGIPNPVDSVRAGHQAMMAETPPDDGHVRTILNPDLGRVGIGVVSSPDGRIYFVCEFIN